MPKFTKSPLFNILSDSFQTSDNLKTKSAYSENSTILISIEQSTKLTEIMPFF